VQRLLTTLDRLIEAARGPPRPPTVDLPHLPHLDVEPVLRPRDAFFGPAESVPADDAVGRVAAEQLTPYPPGIPVVIPGARISQAIIDYLRTGKAAGMVVPDATDGSLETFRVVALP
jgi:arginine decarboxylase